MSERKRTNFARVNGASRRAKTVRGIPNLLSKYVVLMTEFDDAVKVKVSVPWLGEGEGGAVFFLPPTYL